MSLNCYGLVPLGANSTAVYCHQVRHNLLNLHAAPWKQGKSPTTGMLSRLPMVPPAAEHIATALKRAERVKPNLKLKNELQRIRNQATRRMDTLSKEVVAFASYPCTPILRANLSAVLPYVAMSASASV
jgi:hypothetical protein